MSTSYITHSTLFHNFAYFLLKLVAVDECFPMTDVETFDVTVTEHRGT